MQNKALFVYNTHLLLHLNILNRCFQFTFISFVFCKFYSDLLNYLNLKDLISPRDMADSPSCNTSSRELKEKDPRAQHSWD